MTSPFLEHPTGEFETAVDAMADAIKRLRSLSEWNEWITFCAQGMGPRIDTYHLAKIRLRRDELEIKTQLDVALIVRRAGVPPSCLVEREGRYVLCGVSPIQAARILDTIFRSSMGIRPHAGEGDDYAVGVEW